MRFEQQYKTHYALERLKKKNETEIADLIEEKRKLEDSLEEMKKYEESNKSRYNSR